MWPKSFTVNRGKVNIFLSSFDFFFLAEIVKGNVKFQNNRDLCYVQTIDWDDMREGLVPTFMKHGDSCTAGMADTFINLKFIS